jgi:hypothetical protein
MLEFGGEVALEIVLDDEGAEEVGVAASAENVPGEGGEAEGGEGGRMEEAEGVAPALGKERPEKNGAAGENDGGGAFGEDGEAEEKTEEDEGEPGGLGNDRRIFVAREAEYYDGADHGNGEHAAERHVRGGGVGEADHADGGGQEKQEPAGSFRAVEAQGEPSQRERGQKGGEGAGHARGGFADAEELEAEGAAPIKERRLFEPGFSVKARSDPIASLHHVAGDPGVAGFIGADETDGTKVAEVADVERCEDENGPANSGGGARRILGDDGVCLGHGKTSLTSNYYLQALDLLHTVARRIVRAALADNEGMV